jgi:hypothetical protein
VNGLNAPRRSVKSKTKNKASPREAPLTLRGSPVFEAERQALALMDHPNNAKALDGGLTESGRPYFVMELGRPRGRRKTRSHATKALLLARVAARVDATI